MILDKDKYNFIIDLSKGIAIDIVSNLYEEGSLDKKDLEFNINKMLSYDIEKISFDLNEKENEVYMKNKIIFKMIEDYSTESIIQNKRLISERLLSLERMPF